MPITEMDIEQIQTKLVALLGKKAWGVSLGFGSFLTIEFGAPVPNPQNPTKRHGEWHLWISFAVWRLEKGEQVLVASEDPRSRIDKAVRAIEGCHLVSISISPPALETTIAFDQGINLRVFPVSTEKDLEHWLLYMPDGNVLSIGPDTSWSCRRADLP